jgi:hypothetical protein
MKVNDRPERHYCDTAADEDGRCSLERLTSDPRSKYGMGVSKTLLSARRQTIRSCTQSDSELLVLLGKPTCSLDVMTQYLKPEGSRPDRAGITWKRSPCKGLYLGLSQFLG